MFPARCFRRSSVLLTSCSKDRAIKEFAEYLFLRRLVFRDWLAHPGDIHKMLHPNVFACNVATPGAAPEAGGHWHSVCKRTGVAPNLRLPHHDPAYWSNQCQLMNVSFIERVDTTGMPLPPHFEYLLNHIQSGLESRISE